MKRKISCVIAAILLAAGLSGCAENTQPRVSSSEPKYKTVTVAYDTTKYGENWMKQAAAAFEKENVGVKIQLIPSADINGLMNKVFTAGSNVPDIALMEETNWQEFAEKGLISSLDDVYQTSENGKKLSERLQPDLKNYGLYNNKRYVIPWSVQVCGIIYNAGMFLKNGWNVPGNTKELNALMTIIKQSGITPFAWAGKSMDLWDGVVHGWWAQYEGKQSVNTYLAMKSPEVYNQQGRLSALEEFQFIVSDKSNSLQGCSDMDESTMMAAFFKEKAAMVPGNSSLYNQYKAAIPQSFEMKMMKLPAPDGAVQPDLTYLAAGDFLCIPSRCANRDLAGKFVKFLVTTEQSAAFEQLAQTPSALNINYNGSDTFTSSVSELYETTEKVYMVSDQSVYYNHYLDWPFTGMPYLQISMGMQNAQTTFESNYQYAKQNWAKYTQ